MGCEMCRNREENFNSDPGYKSNPIKESISSSHHFLSNDDSPTPNADIKSPLLLETFDNITKENTNNDITSPMNNSNILDSSLLSKQNFNNEEDDEIKAMFSNNNSTTKALQYISMSSPFSISKSPISHETFQGGSTCQKAEDLLTQSTVIFYIEMSFFALWNISYIRMVYPEGKLYYCIKFDEDESSYEKIPLVKIKTTAKPKNEVYIPLTSDISSPNFRIVKPIAHQNQSQKPHKITTELCILTKGKMITITEDEFYIYISKEYEMTKILFYLNSNTLYTNKKIGNANFSVMYYIDAIENLTPSEDKLNEYIKMFQSNKDKLMKYNEEPTTQLVYYDIPNKNLRKNVTTSFEQFKSFDTLKCLYDIPKLLKESSPNLSTLLEVLKSSDITKYDLFEIIKRINSIIGNTAKKNEINDNIIMSYKEILFMIHNDYVNNVEIWDKITIPYLFHSFRKVFFKNTKQKSINAISSDQPMSAEHLKRHTEIVFNIFKSTFIYIEIYNKNKSNIDIDIPLSAINYIAKNIENSFIINTQSNKNSTDELLLPYIISEKKLTLFIEFILNSTLSRSESVLPIFQIITSILKFTAKVESKEGENEILKILSQDQMKQAFQKISTEHCCNSLIMNTLFCIFKLLAESLAAKEIFEMISLPKIKEIFISFKTSFELLHENIIFFIKTVLKHNSEQIKAGEVVNNFFTNNHYEDIISIFVYAIQLIKIKIQNTSDLIVLSKQSYNLFMNMYTCCSIINNINEQNSIFVIKACIQNKFGDLVIDALTAINDKGALCQIDYMLPKNEITSIATKTMLFRLFYHALVLIENLYKVNENALTLQSMKKILNLFCIIEESDNIYNPKEIIKSVDKKNVNTVNQVKGLHEYFVRYKAKVPDIKEMLKTKLLSSNK